jgi:GT2 family glycosyltransferase
MTWACVATVLSQSYPFIDIVVVDNASEPESYFQLKKQLPENIPLIRNEVNLGYSGGNNVGARASGILPDAAFTMILNNDVMLKDPHTAKKLIGVLKSSPERVAVSPLVNTVWTGVAVEKQIQVRRDADFLTCIVSGSWWLRRLPLLRKVFDWHVYGDVRPYRRDEEYECDSVNGCCFVILTDFLESIGFLDEGTFLWFEEIILGRQIKGKHKRCCLATSVVVDHLQGTSTGRAVSYRMNKEYIKSQLYYCDKYLKTGFPAQLLLVAVRVIDFLSKAICQRLPFPRHGNGATA